MISSVIGIANGHSENGQTQFKLDIRPGPIKEDPDAQSAFSSVANTLRAVSCPSVEVFEFCLSFSSKHLKSPPLGSPAQYEGAEMSGTQCLYLAGSHSRALASEVRKGHLRHHLVWEAYHPYHLTLIGLPMRSPSDLRTP